MNIVDFCAKQDGIYGQMRQKEREQTRTIGIEPCQVLVTRRGGFFISLVHSPEISERVATFSAKVGALVPAVVFGAEEIHTTAGSMVGSLQQTQFYFDPELTEHRDNLRAVESVAEALAQAMNGQACSIRFEERPIITSQVIVAPGQPSQGFVDLANTVVAIGERLKVPMVPAWGAHMTVSRFAEKRTPAELVDLFRLVENEPPFGQSRPVGIAVGYSIRHKSEQYVTDLRLTPGHLFPTKFFSL